MSPYKRARVDGRLTYEHRVVAERKLGRPLQPGEVVDHENGDKQDNSPENVQIFPSQAHHMAVEHVRRKRKGGMEPLFNLLEPADE